MMIFILSVVSTYLLMIVCLMGTKLSTLVDIKRRLRLSLKLCRSQCQRSRSNCCTFKKYCSPLNISWPFLWKVANLVQRIPLDSKRPLLISKSHGQRSNCWSWKIAACSISLDTFAGRLQNLLQWITSESKCSLLIFKLHGQRSRSKRWFLYKCCPLTIFKSFAWKLPNLVQWMPLAKRRFCGFLVTLSKVKVKLLVLEKMMIFILSVVNTLTYDRLFMVTKLAILIDFKE